MTDRGWKRPFNDPITLPAAGTCQKCGWRKSRCYDLEPACHDPCRNSDHTLRGILAAEAKWARSALLNFMSRMYATTVAGIMIVAANAAILVSPCIKKGTDAKEQAISVARTTCGRQWLLSVFMSHP